MARKHEINKIPTMEQAIGPHKKICSECGNVKFLREYTVGGNIVLNICTTCLDKRKGAAATSLKALQEEAHFRELVTAANSIKGPKDVCTVKQLAGSLVESCGGLAGLTKEWRGELEKARAKFPGSKLVLDGYYAIAKLIIAASEEGGEQNLDGMSEKELQEELNNSILRLVSSQDDEEGQESSVA